ncbi:MAG: hypothetical protein JWM34_3515 [Ilumatobacteraceae bacterium]|nr:hypothetical protein [Ilumatobacteraceae bacterium]
MPSRDPLTSRLSRWSRSLLLIPVCTVLAIVVLGCFRLSGSSIGMVAENDPSPQAALQLRPNRSDEWRGRTPLVLRQSRNDFAAVTDVGMGAHDTGVLTDLPVKTPGAVLKPHTWIYFVIGVERAFAMEWWLTVLGPFLGIYALMAVLTRSRLISALTGLLVSAAPTLTWWTVPSAGLSVFYGALAAAAFVAALQAVGRRRYVYAGLAGWLVGCFVAMLYLPYLIPLALLFGLVAVVQLRGQLGGHLAGWRTHWKRLTGILASGSAVFLIGLAIYLRDHHTALTAITNSVYPGHRVTHSAGGRPVLMFDAPFDVFTTNRPVSDVMGTNQSEVASGLMLWLPVGIAGGSFSGFRSREAGARALAAVMTVAVVLVGWAILPLPDKFGLVLGLTNVQGSRLVLPLTVAGAMAAGLYVHRMHTDGSFRPIRGRMVVGTVVFAFVTGWVATQIVVDSVAPSRRAIMLLIAAVVVVTFLILDGRTVLGLGGACLLLLFSAVRVNPLQVGLTPLTASPLMHQIDAIRAKDPSALWAASGGDTNGVSILMASGADSLTGISWYADPAMWEQIDPTNASKNAWDRFAYLNLYIDDTQRATSIQLPADDTVSIVTPACTGALQALHVQYVISVQPIGSACLQAVAQPAATGERWIYTVTEPVAA